MRILLIEDEASLAEQLKKGLELKGFSVDWLSESEKASNRILLYKDNYDLILLDLMLPGISGANITQEIREEGITIPIIILTGRAETEKKIDLLNLGADDYVVKPFSFDELLARIHSVLRRPKPMQLTTLCSGTIEMNTSLHKVYKDGKEVPLTTKEYALLEAFLREPGIVLSRQKLFDQLWDFNATSMSNVIEVHMKNLRKKLESSDESEPLFETIRGVGYRLVTTEF